jgi:hypothetical protein
MMRSLATLVFLALGTTAAAAPSPFQNPVKDCRPCRFSPGPDQPVFELTFVFDGSGGERSLTGMTLTAVGGGKTQTLAVRAIAAADFPDGFVLGDPDLNFDGYRDLALTKFVAATNETAEYWIYRPQQRDFAALERVGDQGGGDADAGDFALQAVSHHELYCHIHNSAIEHVDYWYRVEGRRAIAVRQETQGVERGELVSTTRDLTNAPHPILSRRVVGFVGDSAARNAFLRRLDRASAQGRARYRAGDVKGAVAVLAAVMRDKYPGALGNGDLDHKLAAQLNDYGYYLEQAGRPGAAAEVLTAVIGLDADRTVAYLNLADAKFAAGDQVEAKYFYVEYRKRMTAAGHAAQIPPRAAERSR